MANEIIDNGSVKHVVLGITIKSSSVEADGVTRGCAQVQAASAKTRAEAAAAYEAAKKADAEAKKKAEEAAKAREKAQQAPASTGGQTGSTNTGET